MTRRPHIQIVFLLTTVPIPIADIPFELRGVHIYIQARINGQGPFPMNVDTGSYLGLTQSLATRLKLTSEKDALVGGAGAGTQRIGWGKVDSVEIGGAKIEHEMAMLGRESGPVEAGIGEELFRRFTVEFDNDHRRMRLYAKGTVPVRKGASSVPMVITNEGKPLVRFEVGDTPGRFMLDTGAGISIILQRKFWMENRLDHRYRPKLQTIVGHGIGGPIFGRLGRGPALRIGKLRLNDPIVTYSTMIKGSLAASYRDGLVGQQVLLHFNSVFDYAGRRLLLTPSRNFARREPFSRSGLAGSFEGLGYKVEAVYPHGPASDAGLRVGDVLLTIDETILDEKSVGAYFIRPVGTVLHLGVLREGKVVVRDLTLREVL